MRSSVIPATFRSRRLLFGCLYLSEGAPIGFLWLALPTRFRAAGVPIEQITQLMALLVLPWTLKFVWAPLLDGLQRPGWSLRHWIVSAQSLMGLTLLPLLVLDPIGDFSLLAGCLLLHATAAATQDVAIDAWCIAETLPSERGQINGWMQTGMLIGRSMMGGGALVLAPITGWSPVILLLILITTFSAVLVMRSLPRPAVGKTLQGTEHAELPREDRPGSDVRKSRLSTLLAAFRDAFTQRNTWAGLAFALFGGACFKALEVMYGPFLIDRGFSETEVGWFAAVPMIGAMIVGSLLGGMLSDRFGRRPLVAGVLLVICAVVALMSLSDLFFDLQRSAVIPVCLMTAGFGIGVFTAATYAMFMDHTHARVAATQFSAFMGMTNGCESWTSWAAGRIAAETTYAQAFLSLCAVSVLSLALLPLLRSSRSADGADAEPQAE